LLLPAIMELPFLASLLIRKELRFSLTN